MADIRRDIGMAKENWPPAIGGPLQQNAPNILFEMLIILSASEYTIIQCLFWKRNPSPWLPCQKNSCCTFACLSDWFLLNLTQNMQSLETTWIKNPFTAVATFFDNSIPRKRGLGFENVGFQSQQKKVKKKNLVCNRPWVCKAMLVGWLRVNF